jgi:3-phosphoshikimate 1-carboxyvinyltransferase
MPVNRSGPLSGTVTVPGDKAISHRAAIVSSFADGRSLIRNFSSAGDCRRTLAVLRHLGGTARRDGAVVTVDGADVAEWKQPDQPLECGRSGTTMRLMAGVLAGAPLDVVLTGDVQLLARPMERVAEPLRRMGASIAAADGRAPLRIRGRALRGAEHRPTVPSAQVKSCLLLAGLRASGRTTIVERIPTRDHTERLLYALGVPVERSIMPGGQAVSVVAARPSAGVIDIPGDTSSAAALAAAAVLVPKSDIVIQGVGQNPLRLGFFEFVRRMGGEVEMERIADEPEPIGPVRVRHRPLHGIAVGPVEVPSAVDELPLLALLATQAEGVTEVHGAVELRAKESDRIAGTVEGLRALGARIDQVGDGFVVIGPTRLHGGRCDARRDHRLAMAFAVAGLVASGPVVVDGLDYVVDSFPGFSSAIGALR